MALFNRPRSMPRMFQGRMFNRRSGGYAPNLYTGSRPRRASHRFFGTQVSPYGAGGGGRSQMHAGHAGHAGNVYGAMLAQAQSGRGTNMGIRARANINRSTRQLGHYRRGLASAGRDAYRDFMGGRTRSDFGTRREFTAARRQARRERSQARRQYAGNYRNPFTGDSRRRVTTLSRHGGDYGDFRMATRFTTPFTLGMQNRMDRNTTRHQGATTRYRWGQRNPTMQTPIPFLPGGNRQVPLRNLSLGGYRYMSPQFHSRLGQAQRGQATLNQIREFRFPNFGDAMQRARQFNIDQHQQNLNRGLGQLNIG